MAENILQGKIKLIQEQQTFDSGFTKREFVVTTDDARYPQDINFETVKERIALLDKFNEGDAVNVSFDISGREYNGKYFVTLRAWKIERKGSKEPEVDSFIVENDPEDAYEVSPDDDEIILPFW